MKTERSIDVRVATHAALADATRLRMVDQLSFGDASSTELQAVLGIASNLLAHHIGVLERAGLVERRRSEADRRRSYLRLVPSGLVDLIPQGVTTVARVVFVCTANSARSQLAAALWNESSDVPVASAGTHPAPTIAAGAVQAARRHGVQLLTSGPAPLDEVLRPDDFVVTVCDNAHEQLDRTDASPEVRRLHWSVPDPVPAGTKQAFDEAFEDLSQRVSHLAPRLTAS